MSTTMPVVLPEVAHHMALLPLLVLGILHMRGERRNAAWWWLAVACGVSWLADTAAHVVDPWLVSAVYPVTQAALIAAVLTPGAVALRILTGLVAMGLVAVLLRGVRGPDILLHTVAAGTVVAAAWPLPDGRLRLALLVGFGAAGVAWLVFAAVPNWPTWGLFQGMRAVGLGLLGWASCQRDLRLV